jgi:C1A family cysteine protease
MLYNSIFVALFLSLCLAYNHPFWDRFTEFRSKFNKHYPTFDEFSKRYKIFTDNVQFIDKHNSDFTQNFTLGINQFTDMTVQEFKSRNNLGLLKLSSFCEQYKKDSTIPTDSIDWRKNGAVSSVKDQGQCGSCWSFSSTGAIEGAWYLKKGELFNLSEQQLVDCANGMQYRSHGCNGGQMDGAFQYVMLNGQCSDSDYPYESGVTKEAGDCDICDPVVYLSTCYDVPPNDQNILKQAVFKQPVAIAIEADTMYFQSYKSGVLDSSECGTNLDHGVLIVGYGEENGQKFWLVKNSWSESWGEDGYVKISRSDSSNDPGICGIAMQPSFPAV